MHAKIDFDSWEKNGAKDLSHNILISPSNVTVNNIFSLGEKERFSYKQALLIEQFSLIPHGWRLPTIPELFGISERIIRKASPEDKTGIDLKLYLDHAHRCPEIDRVNLEMLFWSSERDLSLGIVHAFAFYDWLFDNTDSENITRSRRANIRRDTAIRARIIAVKDL